MCGIAGAFFVDDPGLVASFAEAAGSLLAHRGPDDEGRFEAPEGVLVHRRLSILDPTPAGHQPFVGAGGRFRIIHNGEIYNYLELRDELRHLGHRFETDTDTEVIAESLAAWDVEAFSRFNGIWALAIWDLHARRLILSRDRLGVKPLYLARLGAGIAFASEIKALVSIAGREPNLSAIRDYLWHGWTDHAVATFHRQVEPLRPATALVVNDRGEARHRYWRIADPSTDADPRTSPGDAATIATFADLLRDTIALQLRSDVAVGSCLSGGLDSSTIVALASRISEARPSAHQAEARIALTASFPGSIDDETTQASATASASGVEHVVVRPGHHGLVAMLDELLAEHDEPFLSSSILAQRAVMRAASERRIKVMLDGQGADELVAGYPHYRYAWLAGLLGRHPQAVPAALRALRRLGVAPGLAIRQAVLARMQLGPTGVAPVGRASRPPAWLGPALRDVPPLPLLDAEDPTPAGTPLALHLRRAALSTSLPALLRYEDRSSMRFGVEARVPFLDHRLVDATSRMPDRLKIASGITKVVLREAGRGLLQEATRTDKRKIGFATPQVDWLTAESDAIGEVLGQSIAVRDGWLAATGVAEALARGPAADGGQAIWRCLSVELWARRLT